MTRKAATDFLIRTVLDETFREQVHADPQRAFQAFDLSGEEKDILISRDTRLLALLGATLARPPSLVERAEDLVIPQPPVAPPPSLPEIKLMLRLEPKTATGADGGSRVSYAASLQAWPGEDAATEHATADGATGRGDDGATSELSWVVRITPTVVGFVDSGANVSYSASISPRADAGNEGEAPGQSGVNPQVGAAPWNHHTESAAAKAAAQAVRACAADQRYEKLLELIGALQTGDARG